MPKKAEADILHAKPAKKSFAFDVKKKYDNVKKFRPLPTPRLDLQTVSGLVSSYFKRGVKPGDKEVEEEFKHKTAPMTKVILDKLLFTIVAFLVIVLLFIALLFFAVSSAGPAPPPIPVSATPSVTYSVQNWGVLSMGKSDDYAAFASIPFQGKDVQKLLFHLDLFQDEVPQSIFVLKSRREQATSYEEFKTYLDAELAKQGLQSNELHIDQLKSLPKGSKSIIIVPSGFFPALFLGKVDPSINVNTFLNEGHVIIYMGYGFDNGVLFEKEGRVKLDANEISKASKLMGILIRPPTGEATESGFSLRDPRYSVQSDGTPVKPMHGTMYALKSGKGYFVFLPQPLDNGWTSGSLAAQDVAKIIKQTDWERAHDQMVSQGEKEIIPSNSSSTGAFLLLSEPYKKTNSFGKLAVSITGLDNRTYGRTVFLKFDNAVRGQLRHDSVALPAELSGQKLGVSGEFNESELVWKNRKPVNVFLVLYNATSRVSSRLLQTEPVTPIALYPVSADVSVEVPSSGDYVLRVEDDEGNVFAQSYLRVPVLNLSMQVENYLTGQFGFEVQADGKPADVKNVRVSLDGLQEKTISSTESPVKLGTRILIYAYTGEVKEGAHAFILEYAGQKTEITTTRVISKNWWDNPFIMAGLAFSIVLLVVGMLLKRPEPVVYGIDVPDFPPSSKVVIPLPPKTVTDLFGSLEAEYGWKYMPLDPREIKNGFRKIVYKGRGVLIGDYNLEKILEALKKKGLVQEALGLWGLSSWVKDSGKSISYLAIFRKLRSTFVNNAVKFTDYGERKDCDTLIKIPEDTFVHIYEGPQSLAKALATCQQGPTAIIFPDELGRREFKRKLYSPDPLLVSLKIMKDKGRLILATADWIEKKVIKKEKKSGS